MNRSLGKTRPTGYRTFGLDTEPDAPLHQDATLFSNSVAPPSNDHLNTLSDGSFRCYTDTTLSKLTCSGLLRGLKPDAFAERGLLCLLAYEVIEARITTYAASFEATSGRLPYCGVAAVPDTQNLIQPLGKECDGSSCTIVCCYTKRVSDLTVYGRRRT